MWKRFVNYDFEIVECSVCWLVDGRVLIAGPRMPKKIKIKNRKLFEMVLSILPAGHSRPRTQVDGVWRLVMKFSRTQQLLPFLVLDR